ncbi:MAG: hypothetical protein HC904_05445 [Blastochloris sp.]|nr:hypothetical protein [Blastochloris sp.]
MPACAASVCVSGVFDENLVRETASNLRQELGERPTCAFVFASHDYMDSLEDFVETLRLHAHIPEVFGCSGRGLIGSEVEQEEGSGFSVLLLSLPGTELMVREVAQEQVEEFSKGEDWRRWSGVAVNEVNSWIALINPLQLNIESWLAGWNQAYPGIPCLGGLASSGLQAEGIQVFHNEEVVTGGLLVGFSGQTRCVPLVSQGCRPIGEPYTITQVERNVIYQLGSKSAFDVLNTVITELTDEERAKARGNVFAGLAASEYLEDFKQGDFLVRNILGANPQTGEVVIGSLPRIGQTLQYQMRDRSSAELDMKIMLEKAKDQPAPLASLVFSCIGRGHSFLKTPLRCVGPGEQSGSASQRGLFL